VLDGRVFERVKASTSTCKEPAVTEKKNAYPDSRIKEHIPGPPLEIRPSRMNQRKWSAAGKSERREQNFPAFTSFLLLLLSFFFSFLLLLLFLFLPPRSVTIGQLGR